MLAALNPPVRTPQLCSLKKLPIMFVLCSNAVMTDSLSPIASVEGAVFDFALVPAPNSRLKATKDTKSV